MSKVSEKKAQQEIAVSYLREYLSPGMTVYGKVTHVSRSGMQRSIDFYIPTQESKSGELGIYRITHLIARALDLRIDNTNGGVKVSGCGMDMIFATTYNLAYTLFPNWKSSDGRRSSGYALNSQSL